ncbi:GNAT family N-acetyltransferase [Salipiger sp. P9]|uniref:GNAT family N-acetyltransferase n=1 Tax=Salipiger pentaromativorans TaxID=2943193 RepID=UPI0021575F8D|nr:GNAT family N-acetyltransferase [Salipiger pentaromativorans]MCR8550840.1 GNAT family N-acetyltransferase [Salipiger pentaromativorans]
MPAPVLHTPRLTLRGHVMADFEQLCDLFESDRARFMGGPLPRKEAWRWLASEVGMWDLIGLGSWGIEDKDGRFLGQIGLLHPPHYPETEIGWTLLEEAEGKGYATEAARAVLLWAWDQGIETLVSYITPGNDRSIALAERLGAVRDPAAALPPDETPEETIVYRHSPDSDGSPEAYA